MVFKKQLYTKKKTKKTKKHSKTKNYKDKTIVKNYFKNIDSDMDDSFMSDKSFTNKSTCSDDFEYEYFFPLLLLFHLSNHKRTKKGPCF